MSTTEASDIGALARDVSQKAQALVQRFEALAEEIREAGVPLVAIDVRDVVARLSRIDKDQQGIEQLAEAEKWQKIGEMVGDHHDELERVVARMLEVRDVVNEAGLDPIEPAIVEIAEMRRWCHRMSMICVTTTQPIDIE